MKLKVKGLFSSRAEIINPDLYIAILNEDAELSPKITVQERIGFKPAKMIKPLDIFTLSLDANFALVKRIEFEMIPPTEGKEIITWKIETTEAISAKKV